VTTAPAVNWDQRGLGEGDINYTLTADATALYACLNGGGKSPSAANKRSFEGQVSSGGTFEAKKGPGPGDPHGRTAGGTGVHLPTRAGRVLAAVSYTNIVLTDTTNGVSTSVPDASRTFFNV
jgi:hypothetical protein